MNVRQRAHAFVFSSASYPPESVGASIRPGPLSSAVPLTICFSTRPHSQEPEERERERQGSKGESLNEEKYETGDKEKQKDCWRNNRRFEARDSMIKGLWRFMYRWIHCDFLCILGLRIDWRTESGMCRLIAAPCCLLACSLMESQSTESCEAREIVFLCAFSLFCTHVFTVCVCLCEYKCRCTVPVGFCVIDSLNENKTGGYQQLMDLCRGF